MASGPAARVEGETGGGEVGDGEAGEGLGDESARQEKEHFQKVINAFLYYKWAGLLIIAHALFITAFHRTEMYCIL